MSFDILGLFAWSPPDGFVVKGSDLHDPDFPLPYRADLLTAADTHLQVLPNAVHPLHCKVRDVVEHRTGVRLDRWIRSAGAARRADAVLAFLEAELAAPSWARRHRVGPWASTPLVGISCWWAEELVREQRQPAEVRRVMEGVDRLVVFSTNQVEIFAKAGVDPAKIRPVKFGVDETFYRPAEGPMRFQVLAAGVDRGRDWETLLAAAHRLPGVRFDLFTTPASVVGLAVPPNLTVHAPVDIERHQQNMQAAEVVVVPTHDLAYPTGQSVMLEGMASGACVAVTETSAMAEYIQDGTSNLALPLHDPEGVARVIEEAVMNAELRARVGEGGRRAVETRFTFTRMWEEMRDIIRQVI